MAINSAGNKVVAVRTLVPLLLLSAACGSPQGGPGTKVADQAGCRAAWMAHCSEAAAYWLAPDLLAWNVGAEGDNFVLRHAPQAGLYPDQPGGSGEAFTLTAVAAALPQELLARFPHLSGYQGLQLDESAAAKARELLRGQLLVEVSDAAGNFKAATGVQLPGVIDALFQYDGDLGVSMTSDGPVFRLWAPTARAVDLEIFESATATTPLGVLGLERNDLTGVWQATGFAAWEGLYYEYVVEVFVPGTGKVERNRVTDPYSLALGPDSSRSQVVDLDNPALKPAGWDTLAKPQVNQPVDISIYELHVRDFSIADMTVPTDARGTFAAFTHTDSAGMQHLHALAEAGLTHLHLLPVFDFATVPEHRSAQATPDRAALESLAPDSPQQQAMIAAIKEQDGFNWGYDPWHYTVPEGSYSMQPDGAARTLEFRRMVKALNDTGLNVVMDVVYNHTSQSGQAPKSVLDRIVPGYYQRLDSRGRLETSTCCANTATEHAMMEKLMIDSVLTWARAYKVDGFRFDLMGHHSKENMLNLRAALDALTLAKDGVDGQRIYLYGEGWNFGEVANDARFEQATQANMAGTGIGTFNDRLRDGVRGGTPFIDPREQGFATGLGYDPNDWEAANGDDDFADARRLADWIRVGLAGALADYAFESASGAYLRGREIDYFDGPAGYTASPEEQITYVAAHDNETLFDVIQMKAPSRAGKTSRVRMQNLANSIVLLSQGIPFIHAGQDILRSKSMDRDSFNSGDWFNEIDWSLATGGWGRGLPGAEKNESAWPLMGALLRDPAIRPDEEGRRFARAHLLELLEIRSSSPLFRLGDAGAIQSRLTFHNTGAEQVPGLIVMKVSDPEGEYDPRWSELVVIFNAGSEDRRFAWEAEPDVSFALHPVQQGSIDPTVKTAAYSQSARSFFVPPRSTAVFVRERPRQGRYSQAIINQ